VLAAALLTATGAATASVPSAAGGWGRAEEVPGLAALNAGGSAGVASVSCPRVGYCGAGGSYADRSGHHQAFVVSETKGHWDNAEEVPGTAALNAGGNAVVTSVSCAPAGDCAAGGSYTDRAGHQQVFVVNEVNGRWGKAEEVPRTAWLNRSGYDQVNSVSCSSSGSCSAGGYYQTPANLPGDSDPAWQAFVVNETKGRWGNAEEVPGTAALNGNAQAEVTSVSCPAAGDCEAGGYYAGGGEYGIITPFSASELNGRWGLAQALPGLGGLSVSEYAELDAMACPSVGNCSAVGFYQGTPPVNLLVFGASQKNGRWSNVVAVPAAVMPNGENYAQLGAISCWSPRNCAAVGSYVDGDGNNVDPTVATERYGRWSAITAMAGAGGYGQGNSVSCPSAGNCAAGGSHGGIAFLVSDRKDRWGAAFEPAGLAALDKGQNSYVSSVSCSSAGNCGAGGSYTDGSGHGQGFVVSATS
jgi:hypothetical protein